MSYEIGQLPARRRYAVRHRRALPGCAAIGRAGVLPVSIPDQGDALSGLEFSLKPPKWLRKAQPGKIIAKAAIPLAIGASLLIPGVAPVVMTAAKGLFAGAKLVAGGVAGKVVSILRPHPNIAPPSLPEAQQTIPPGFSQTLPYFGPQPMALPASFRPADNTMPATVTQAAAPPGAQANFQTAQVAASQGPMTFGTPEGAAASAPAGGINPALIVGALAVGALLLIPRKRGA